MKQWYKITTWVRNILIAIQFLIFLKIIPISALHLETNDDFLYYILIPAMAINLIAYFAVSLNTVQPNN